jgi:acylphosphatase
MKVKKYTMERVRMRLIVEGNVQGVGYRALVKQVARELKIRGLVRNLEDGTVEIFCEAEENVIQQFINKINVVSEKKAPFDLNVRDIRRERVGKLPVEKDFFYIDYGEEAKSPFEESNLERLEIGSLILSGFKNSTEDNFNSMDGKYGNISKQMVNVEKTISKSLNEISETNKRFADLIEAVIKKPK